MTSRRLELPPLAREIQNALPPGLPVWLVGGAVRDLVLGRPVHDLDLAVEENALEVARDLASKLGGAFVPLDARRGCARVVLPDEALEIDLADFRAPGLRADLLARDFTLNALAIDLAGDGTVVDPTGGLVDLDNRIVRLIHRDALHDDPLRGLRGVRIATELDFDLDPSTAREIRALAPTLSRSAAERSRDELLRCLATPRAATALRQLADLGLLEPLLPELATLQTKAPERFHHLMQVVQRLEPVLATLVSQNPALKEALEARLAQGQGGGPSRHTRLRLAAALHDVGKEGPNAVAGEDHAETGARLVKARLESLRLAGADVRAVATIVRNHTRPLEMRRGSPLSRGFLFRFLRRTSGEATAIGILMLADREAKRASGAAGEPADPEGPEDRHLGDRVVELLQADLIAPPETFAPPPLVTGHDLVEADICPPGPAMGPLLNHLLEAQVVGEVSTVEEALDLARTVVLSGLPGTDPEKPR